VKAIYKVADESWEKNVETVFLLHPQFFTDSVVLWFKGGVVIVALALPRQGHRAFKNACQRDPFGTGAVGTVKIKRWVTRWDRMMPYRVDNFKCFLPVMKCVSIFAAKPLNEVAI
jgi:hypothetical protein